MVDALADAMGEAEPQAKSEASAGLVVRAWLTERHEVPFGRHRRLDRHEQRQLALSENTERRVGRTEGVFGRCIHGEHETDLERTCVRYRCGGYAARSAFTWADGSASS